MNGNKSRLRPGATVPVLNVNAVDAPRRARGRRLVAELVDPSGWFTAPYAVAWLTDCRGSVPSLVYLDFILVPDHLRRRGHAKALVMALSSRYGESLVISEAISDEGEALAASLAREGVE